MNDHLADQRVRAVAEMMTMSLHGKLSADIPGLVEKLLQNSRESGASDLHLTPLENGLECQIRLDGVLHHLISLPKDVAAAVVARIKVLAGLLTYRQETPQEGRIPKSNDPERPEIRVSTFPTLHGERAALRFLMGHSVRSSLDDLGFRADQKEKIISSLANTDGMFVITGPAGVGKTTTFYACLREIRNQSEQSRSILTLEDPVESALSGVVQTSLDHRFGLGLAKLVKAVMRQDPDVIGIGEIRDRATARAAFQATLTGHLVLTTTHAGDGAELLTRLLEMRIAPYVLRNCLRLIISQRLLRRLCPDCRIEVNRQRHPEKSLGLDLGPFWSETNPVGCPSCRGTGYAGRLLIAQVVDMNSQILADRITAQTDAISLRKIIQQAGMKSLIQEAIERIHAGETTPSEVRRVFGISAADCR